MTRHHSYFIDDYYSLLPSENNKYYNYKSYENMIYEKSSIIKNLETYCNMLKIKLIWSSWSELDSMILGSMGFKNYLQISNKEVSNSFVNLQESDDKYFYIGRDNAHPGLMFSDGLAELFLKEYNNKYGK